MDSDELQSTIFAKIRILEPEYATKIFGYLFSLDIDIRDLIRLALGPDKLVQSFCQKAKSDLGLSSINPNSRPIHRQPFYQSSPNNEFLEFSRNPHVFASSSGDFVGEQQQQLSWYKPLNNEDPFANWHKSSFSTNDNRFRGPGYRFPQAGLVDEKDHVHGQLQRNADANDFNILLQTQNAQRQRLGLFEGAGYRFPQAGLVDERDNIYLQEEMMRMKSAQHSRQEFLHLEQAWESQQRQGPGQFGEEFGYSYSHENEEAVSRQIYFKFPPGRSFSKFDVAGYFSIFGNVEEVKIPNQPQRMFGFVTFANSETARMILAHGNPHFISGSRVTVKPPTKIRRNYQIQGSEHFGDEVSPYIERSPMMFSNNTNEMFRMKAESEQAMGIEPPQSSFPEREIDSIHHHMRRLSIDSRAYFTRQEESGYSNNIYNGQGSGEFGEEGTLYIKRILRRPEMLSREAEQEQVIEEVEPPQRRRFLPESILHHRSHLSIDASAYFLSHELASSSQEHGYKGQENTIPDSLHSSPDETRQNGIGAEENKAESSDKSA